MFLPVHHQTIKFEHEERIEAAQRRHRAVASRQSPADVVTRTGVVGAFRAMKTAARRIQVRLPRLRTAG